MEQFFAILLVIIVILLIWEFISETSARFRFRKMFGHFPQRRQELSEALSFDVQQKLQECSTAFSVALEKLKESLEVAQGEGVSLKDMKEVVRVFDRTKKDFASASELAQKFGYDFGLDQLKDELDELE